MAAEAGFDLDGVRAVVAGIDGLRAIGMREITIGPAAIDRLVPAVASLRRGDGPVTMLVDRTPMRRGGADLKADIARRLEGAFPSRCVVIGPDRELHADEAAVAEADAAIAGASCVVTVGSGTITDIGKDASFRAGGIPFVVVQTAVSVNAFSDDMAVLLRDGVKRTVPSRWPDVLLVDLEVLADAPLELNRAGFGELTAMFTAPADWYLASVVGIDDSYREGVTALFRAQGERFLASAAGVARRDRASLADLARLMTLSGIAMGVAGRTAPFSGMEHTVSHLLDMAAGRDGREPALHGGQVGVAAAIVAIVWRRLLRRFDPDRLLSDAAFPSPTMMEQRIEAGFGTIDPSGRVSAECWRDYQRKLSRWSERRPGMAAFARNWPQHRRVIEGLIGTPESIIAGLRQSGCPTRFADLSPAPPRETVAWALEHCHLLRDRFTVADLCFLGDSWGPDDVDEVLSEAAAMGAGA